MTTVDSGAEAEGGECGGPAAERVVDADTAGHAVSLLHRLEQQRLRRCKSLLLSLSR